MKKETYSVLWFDNNDKVHGKDYKNRKSAEKFACKLLDDGMTDEIDFYVMCDGKIVDHTKCH